MSDLRLTLADELPPKPTSSEAALERGRLLCERCGESTHLVKIHGCVRCEVCGFKADCG